MKVKDIIKNTEWLPNPRYSSVNPKFSIFMPTFRRGASGHLERAIQSVLCQTYQEFELIIIDDASVDGSFDIIKKYIQADPRVHCLHHPRNVGLPAISCYEAYKVSRGEYLMFCFDDTEYLPEVVQNVDKVVQSSQFKIAFGYIQWETLASDGSVDRYFLGKDDTFQHNLAVTNFLPNMGAVLHRSLPEEIGFLDPHLAIARLTDWDYWKRAAKVYELRRMDIHFGTEYGLVTGNSLGQTYPLGTWLSYEWTELERNEALKPENYEDYDVQSIPSELSYLARQTLLDVKQFYASKFWYVKNSDVSLRLTQLEHGRILVVAPELSASISLPFEHLSKNYFRFITSNHLDFKEVFNAQAVILCRDLVSAHTQRFIQILQMLNIPMYYYVDDNFVILNDEIDELKGYTSENLRTWLQDFSGVLVSTPALAEYFLQEKIHQKIYAFPPVLPERAWFDYSAIPPKPAGTFRIGVICGSHRYRHFLDYIQPALKRLAQKYQLEIVIVGDLLSHNREFTVYRYPIDHSYKLTLGRLMTSEIDALVHPASFTDNNQYKTLNILINAWAIGAVPVLANQPPYENVEREGLGFLCDPDEIDSWYEKMELALSDPARAKQIRANLDSFLRREYSGRENDEVIQKILSEIPALGFAAIENRYRAYISMLSEIEQDLARNNILQNTSAFTLVRIVLSRVKSKIGFIFWKLFRQVKST